MTAADPAKKFQSLLRRLRNLYPHAAHPSPLPDSPDDFDPLVHELIFSILMWNVGTTHARSALKRLREQLVDYNEMRVCLADELAGIIGAKQPFAVERALRLKACAADLFQRQHRVSLAHLVDAPKRDARAFLDSIEGVPAFAASRVAALRLDIHAAPVDDRLLTLLREELQAADLADVQSAASWLERCIPAGEMVHTAAIFQAWADDEGHAPKREKSRDSDEAANPESNTGDTPPRSATGKIRGRPRSTEKPAKSISSRQQKSEKDTEADRA